MVVKKCEICSDVASVFLTQVINGKSTKFCLCAKCAKERGLLDPDAFDLAEKLFPNLKKLAEEKSSHPLDSPVSVLGPKSLTSCPVCSFTLKDFRKVGRLGCSEGYQIFEEEILPLLNQFQSDSQHHGKTPEKAEIRENEARTINDLEQQLSLAIAKENYELAAQLRDEINQLRASSN